MGKDDVSSKEDQQGGAAGANVDQNPSKTQSTGAGSGKPVEVADANVEQGPGRL